MRIGDLVKTTEKVNNYETELDEGMIGRVKNIEIIDVGTKDEHIAVLLDMNEDMVYNRKKMRANYYDMNLNPVLTSEEAGYWPKNNKINIFLGIDDLKDTFEIIQESDTVGESQLQRMVRRLVEYTEEYKESVKQHPGVASDYKDQYVSTVLKMVEDLKNHGLKG